jgi:SNF2 family DNA or RNA helicase
MQPQIVTGLFEFEIYKQPSEIFAVVLNAVIQWLDMWLLKKAFDFFAQLTTAFSGNYFHFRDPFFDGFFKSITQRFVNCLAIIVDIMQIEFDPSHFSKIQAVELILDFGLRIADLSVLIDARLRFFKSSVFVRCKCG